MNKILLIAIPLLLVAGISAFLHFTRSPEITFKAGGLNQLLAVRHE
jgi:hypothetical protein